METHCDAACTVINALGDKIDAQTLPMTIDQARSAQGPLDTLKSLLPVLGVTPTSSWRGSMLKRPLCPQSILSTGIEAKVGES